MYQFFVKRIDITWHFLLLSVPFLMVSCSKPLPPEKSNYVGEWQGMGMYLLILQDGSVSYKRIKGGGNVSINSPLKAFEGDDFIVSIGFITTKFVVSVPPYEDDDGTWKMVVDGVKLKRTVY